MRRKVRERYLPGEMEKGDRVMYSMAYGMYRTQDLCVTNWVNAIYLTNFIYVVRSILGFYTLPKNLKAQLISKYSWHALHCPL